MSLRSIEIILPASKRKILLETLTSKEIIDYWKVETFEDREIYKILVKSESTEGLLKKLLDKFSGEEKFRVLVSEIIATIPEVEEDSKKKIKKLKRIRVSREELYASISDFTKLNYIYLSLILLSTLIAAFGFINNNSSVIIGAMVIAPLLGPNLAISFSTVLGDFELEKKAYLALFTGVMLSFLLSLVMGLIFEINPELSEFQKRIFINLGDIVIAIASGIAGVLSFTTGAALNLVGVMVSISLLPPLVASGLLIGGGFYLYGLSSFLLFLANFASLNLAGVITFLFQGVKPAHWWEEKRIKPQRIKALILWSILLLILALAIYLERKYLS